MSIAQSLIIHFVLPLISVLIFLVIIEVVVSWLIAFNVINLRNPMMAQIYYGIQRLTRPLSDPVRRILPPTAGIDFSPLVVLLILNWLRWFVGAKIFPILG
jgi:YggT family protein